jgi:peptidoglycan/LPS O-acetylase OafA/YrhL
VWRWALPVLPVVHFLARAVPSLQGNAQGGWNAQAAVYALWEPFVAWGVILALLFRCQQHRIWRKGWQTLGRRAYAIFIIHPPVLVGVALAWRQVDAPALFKFAVTGTVSSVLCYALAGVLLRSSALRRLL